MGGVVQYNLMDILTLEGGLVFSLKGVKYKNSFATYDYKSVTNVFYIVIPITAKYVYDLGAIGLYGQLGPYIGIALAGKNKTVDELSYGDDATHTHTVDFGSSSSDDLKRADFGLTLGVGVVVFNNIQAGIFLEQGLLNLSPYTGNGYRIKNSVFGLTVLYVLGK